MELPDLVRYGTWGGVVATAAANRRHYRLTTTWLPHLATNSLALLLPDIYRALSSVLDRSGAPRRVRGLARMVVATLDELVRDNPAYVAYVLPLAAGYLLSGPRFTIYKGELAELRLAGFGLDAIPHAATAFALSALVGDLVRTAARVAGPEHAPLLARAARAEHALTAAALALATLLWEVGEYRIHHYELRQRGSADAINMQWSPEDTLYDCFANAIGWAAATLWRTRR